MLWETAVWVVCPRSDAIIRVIRLCTHEQLPRALCAIQLITFAPDATIGSPLLAYRSPVLCWCSAQHRAWKSGRRALSMAMDDQHAAGTERPQQQ